MITSDRLVTFIRLLSLVIPLQRLPIIIMAAGDRGAPLLFNVGNEFSIRNVLIGMDQNGRGKGDLVTSQSIPGFGLMSNRKLVFHGTIRMPTQVRC